MSSHYRRLIEAHIADARDKQRYRRAVALLLRMRGAATAAAEVDGFRTYVTELRRTNPIRPNFTELDKAHSDHRRRHHRQPHARRPRGFIVQPHWTCACCVRARLPRYSSSPDGTRQHRSRPIPGQDGIV